jgi:Leucine-rich repeat (LRR) protein
MAGHPLIATPSFKCQLHHTAKSNALSKFLPDHNSSESMQTYSPCLSSVQSNARLKDTSPEQVLALFPNLQSLSLWRTPLKENAFGLLPTLSILSLLNAEIEILPEEFGQLGECLEYLNLSSNLIERLLDWFASKFRNICHLVLDDNLIGSLPSDFGSMTKLRVFSLKCCQLKELPTSFKDLLVCDKNKRVLRNLNC